MSCLSGYTSELPLDFGAGRFCRIDRPSCLVNGLRRQDLACREPAHAAVIELVPVDTGDEVERGLCQNGLGRRVKMTAGGSVSKRVAGIAGPGRETICRSIRAMQPFGV